MREAMEQRRNGGHWTERNLRSKWSEGSGWSGSGTAEQPTLPDANAAGRGPPKGNF